jgi:mannose-6-phosphate isomerase-like protein (cupin superfamily)
MLIRDLKDRPEFIAGDNTVLRELFNPEKDDLNLRYSLAHARVKPGQTTYKHKLTSSEVYYILEGMGEMRIDDEVQSVGPDQAVYIPPNSVQYITNTGDTELVFLCIVDPAWRSEDEEILE